MPNWNNLTSKVIQTVEADGILGLGKRGGRYLKKRFGALAKKESELIFKDVLFIDGCGAVLPHPSRYRVSHQREQLLSYGITSDQVYFADLDLKQIGWYNVFVFFRCPQYCHQSVFHTLDIDKNQEYCLIPLQHTFYILQDLCHLLAPCSVLPNKYSLVVVH